MKKENRNTLLFVPLVGKTSACRQKEGLKLIKNLPRLTALLPQSGKDAMKSPSFGTTCHFPHKGGRSLGSTHYLTQGRENNGCFTSSQNVGQALPDNKGRSLRPLRSLAHSADYSAPLAGEVRRSRVGGLLKNIATTSEKVGVARMRGCSLFNLINPSPALRASSPARGEEDVVRGFTLIELLVVVLIIGILAAVALPQYQKAVERARTRQAMTLLSALAKASQFYFIEQGTYPTSFEQLPLGIPGTTYTDPDVSPDMFSDALQITDWAIEMVNNSNYFGIQMNRLNKKDGRINLGYFFKAADKRPLNEITCMENTTSVIKPGIFCEKILNGKLVTTQGGYRWYTNLQ